MSTDLPAEHESRAARRALRAGAAQADPAAPTARPRPVMAASAVVVALALAAAAGSGERILEVVVIVVAGLLVGAGWPYLVGSRTPIGMSAVLMVTALALGAALLVQAEEPYLEHVPAALALGVVAMCLHPLVQASARVHLAESLAATALGLVIICGGALFASTVFVGAGGPVVVVGVALAVAVLVDLVLERPRLSRWMIPAAMLVGGLTGLLVHALVSGGLDAWPVLLGVTGAGAAVALRRAMAQQPAVDSVPAAVAAGAASILLVAPLVHLVARLPLS